MWVAYVFLVFDFHFVVKIGLCGSKAGYGAKVVCGCRGLVYAHHGTMPRGMGEGATARVSSDITHSNGLVSSNIAIFVSKRPGRSKTVYRFSFVLLGRPELTPDG